MFGGVIANENGHSTSSDTTLLGAVLGTVFGVAAIVVFTAFFVVTRRRRGRELSHHNTGRPPAVRSRPPSELDWSHVDDLDSAASEANERQSQQLPNALEKPDMSKPRQATRNGSPSHGQNEWKVSEQLSASDDKHVTAHGLLAQRSTSHSSAFVPVASDPIAALQPLVSHPTPVTVDEIQVVLPPVADRKQPNVLESVGNVAIAGVVETKVEANATGKGHDVSSSRPDVVSPPAAKKKSQRDPSHKHRSHHSKTHNHRGHHHGSKHRDKSRGATKKDDSAKVDEVVNELVASMAMKDDLDARLQKRLASHDTDASLIVHLIQEREKVTDVRHVSDIYRPADQCCCRSSVANTRKHGL